MSPIQRIPAKSSNGMLTGKKGGSPMAVPGISKGLSSSGWVMIFFCRGGSDAPGRVGGPVINRSSTISCFVLFYFRIRRRDSFLVGVGEECGGKSVVIFPWVSGNCGRFFWMFGVYRSFFWNFRYDVFGCLREDAWFIFWNDITS